MLPVHTVRALVTLLPYAAAATLPFLFFAMPLRLRAAVFMPCRRLIIATLCSLPAGCCRRFDDYDAPIIDARHVNTPLFDVDIFAMPYCRHAVDALWRALRLCALRIFSAIWRASIFAATRHVCHAVIR